MLFRIDGKGIVKKVKSLKTKNVVILPVDWSDVKYVRLYKLRELKIKK